jgi:hypothetical protein
MYTYDRRARTAIETSKARAPPLQKPKKKEDSINIGNNTFLT